MSPSVAQLRLAPDSRSAEAMARHHGRVEVVPNLSFATPNLTGAAARRSGDQTLVVDSVYRDMSQTLIRYARTHGFRFKRMGVTYPYKVVLKHLVRPFWFGRLVRLTDIRRAGFVVTGRFHAATRSAACGVPFLALPSNTYKIDTLVADMGLSPATYVCSPDSLVDPRDQIQAIQAAWDEGDGQRVRAYVDDADRRIRQRVREIREDLDVVGVA